MKKKKKGGRPTNKARELKYKIGLSLLHFKYLVPKKFRSSEVFGIILEHELRQSQRERLKGGGK